LDGGNVTALLWALDNQEYWWLTVIAMVQFEEVVEVVALLVLSC